MVLFDIAAATAPAAGGAAPAGETISILQRSYLSHSSCARCWVFLYCYDSLIKRTFSITLAAAKKEEKPKEEEVDALDGGMDMFGGGGGGGGDY